MITEQMKIQRIPKKNYDKVKELIDFIEVYEVITPKEAENIAKRSAATVRRYLKMLVDAGCIVPEGNTNNSKYHVSTNWNDRLRR